MRITIEYDYLYLNQLKSISFDSESRDDIDKLLWIIGETVMTNFRRYVLERIELDKKQLEENEDD